VKKFIWFLLFSFTFIIQNSFALKNVMVEKMLANIHPDETLPGIVVASPSKQDPDYWFHWERDAALVMNTVVDLYQENHQNNKIQYLKMLLDYAYRVKQHQETYTLTGLGEPKFLVSSEPFNGPWGRPQNDGPALRVITLAKVLAILEQRQQWDLAFSLFYRAELPAETILKRDLEFVAHHWRESNFDLWEEVKGDHFYTRMVQEYALRIGADIAEKYFDPYAAAFYRQTAQEIANSLQDFKKDFIWSHLNIVDGHDGKKSNLDTAVLLAILHTDGQGAFKADDASVINTYVKLKTTFKSLYPINATSQSPLVGRYPEDYYYGGHPWILTTMAMASYLQALQTQIQKQKKFVMTADLVYLFPELATGTYQHGHADFAKVIAMLSHEADNYWQRVLDHFIAHGGLAEQVDKSTGLPLSARELTWSYSSVLHYLNSK
jgi:glucoamylase